MPPEIPPGSGPEKRLFAGFQAKRWIGTTIAAVALIGFVLVVTYAYDQGKRVGSEAVVPVIEANKSPAKTKPDRPGGMAVPDRDKLVFDRVSPGAGNQKIEQLLPLPEVPLKPPAKTAAKLPEGPSPANGKSVPIPPPPAVAETKKLPSKPAVKPAPPAVKLPPSPPAFKPPPPPPTATISPRPVAKPKAKPAVKPVHKAVSANGYRVQLAALRSRAAAVAAWGRLSKTHAVELGKLTPRYVAVTLGARGTFYRIQAGPLPSEQAARSICARLTAKKQGCLIVRP